MSVGIAVKNPVSKTLESIASGTYVSLFSIPYNKIGKLLKIQTERPSKAGYFRIYDSYQDSVTTVSGFTLRKGLAFASGVSTIENVNKTVKLFQDIKVYASVSGFNVTVSADLE